MSKQPKEQARDYVWHNYGEGDFNEYNWDRSAEEIWLSGYRAAQQWISVKERLPEEGFGWTMVYGCILSRWAVQPGFYDKDTSEWVSRFIGGDGDKEGYAPFESVTHWMRLPEAPKGEE